ncbi:hypothetical protein F5X96DRAFT_688843 [Biscogniauxia mediterranea]|nr:hypothetical protein F5X96DRAFT_688843 [Biscogniauxia mediterranea]
MYKVMIGMATWLPFGGLSRFDTEPAGTGIVGPSRSIACRGKAEDDDRSVTSPTTLRIPFLFAGLPGWWLGCEDGRSQTPTLTEAQDFTDDSMHSFSVMVSQAIDDRIDILRDPLSLAGGVAHIENRERPRGRIEEATFARMDPQRVSSIQLLFREAKYILWATRGCRADDPYANIIVDLPNYGDLLWTNETELAVEDGTVLIPRVVPDDDLNNSFNSMRRRITRSVSIASNPVEISTNHEGITIHEMRRDAKEAPQASSTPLQVLSSSMFRFSCSDGSYPFYLSLGYYVDTKQKVSAISETSGLTIWVAPDSTFACNSDANADEVLSLTTKIVCAIVDRDVGISLCEWMADHGANVSLEVLASLQNKGVTVRIFTLDVTDMENLGNVHKEIHSSMPPIAGVANAALVVRDHLFDGILEVIGTQNLDKLFYSTPLDFFILFSYNAANLFMSTLAAQRRKRGLAASAMHFGMLVGLGFIHGQADPTVEARFRQDDMPALPEPDFHAVFSQAILSGRPESGLNSELIAGLGTEINTPWRAMPRFSHCHNHHIKEAYDTIASRLSLALGSPSEDVDEQVGLIRMGLDSLVAVEIRSWLLKILEVDVPVLKFLSGSSLNDICHDDNDEDNGHAEPNGESNGNSSSMSNQEFQVVPVLNAVDKKRLVVNAADGSDMPTHSTVAVSNGGIIGIQTEYERVGDMSYAQAQLYFLHEYLQNNAYNVACCGRFHSRLDIKRLQEALWVFGKRHEAMRSAYLMDASTARPLQAVIHEPRIILEHRTDFRFEIEKGIVMKLMVMSHSPSLHSIIFNHHHIALDGIAWSVFIADLAQAYSGHISSIPRAIGTRQSIDMARRQIEASTPENHHADIAFWKTIYKSLPELLPLFPFSKVKTRPTAKDYSISTCDVKLPGELTKLVEKTASRVGITSFHFYLASLATFLARCLGVSDVAIGVVDANRSEAEDMRTTGYFLNMLPVRIQLQHSEQFDAVARRSRDAALAALSHSQTPFAAVLDTLEILKSSDYHSWFQIAINYRKAALNETSFGSDGKIQWDGAVPGGHPYDLLLNVAAIPDWTFISFITQRSLYDSSDGALLLKWYTRALEALARGPCLEAIELGRGSEMTVTWNGTLTDRIDEVSAELPESIAIKDDQGQTLTYAQMTARVLQISRHIRALSPPPTPGSYVAMLFDPVADAVCCILTILRLSLRRLRAVVNESQPRILVCHNETKELAQNICAGMGSMSILNIDDADDDGRPGHDEGVDNTHMSQFAVKVDNDNSSQPAMIIYTSGSTGVPKGIMLTHEGLVNQIYGTTATLHLGQQIFLALCNGGTVVVVGKTGRGDPTHMAELIVRHGVTLTHFVPSEYSALLNYGRHILANARSWRYAMSRGEKLGQELRRAFRKLECEGLKLVNVYGPAEITLACCRGIVPYRESDDVNDRCTDYLRPSPNYGLQITVDDMNILPVGLPGEICISGRGVGLGYIERPEETDRKFTKIRLVGSSSEVRIYRSGDKGRLLPDGTLEVLGRLDGDSQVKIHGFRDILVGFVVFDVAFTEDKSHFIEWLRSNIPLPQVMKPTFIVPTDRIPATANGKIDKGAVDKLHIPKPMLPTGTSTHSFTPWEQAMKEVWEEVLNWKRCLIKLESIVTVQFEVTISMPELFNSSTLSSMARLVAEAMDSSGAADLTSKTASFLGRHLLTQLIRDPRVAQVHCLAIRPDTSGKPRHVSVLSDKVAGHAGDLSMLSLGLSESQFTSLAERAHAIIHNGADVFLLKTYLPTAIPRRVPLHYVSTASVAKVVGKEEEAALLEWASERLLEKAAADNGLPAYVHRLAHVYSLLQRSLPREDVSGRWDFVMAPDVAGVVVESAAGDGISPLQQRGQQSLRPRFVNHCNDVKVSHEDLRGYLEGMARGPLAEMEMSEWLLAARERGLHPSVHEFFATFDEGRGTMVLPVIAKGT